MHASLYSLDDATKVDAGYVETDGPSDAAEFTVEIFVAAINEDSVEGVVARDVTRDAAELFSILGGNERSNKVAPRSQNQSCNKAVYGAVNTSK